MDSGTPTTVTPTALASPVVVAPFRAQMLAPQRVGDPQAARAFARPYREVAERLARWEAQGNVSSTAEAGFHLHEYTVGGLTARGWVLLLDLTRLAPPGAAPGVFPHEDVQPDQVHDLAERMEEMGLNPAPILLVHEGPAELRALVHQIVVGAPDTAFADRQGNQHRLWHVTDAAQIRRIQTLLEPSHLMIADGHHRYAAYLEMARRHPESGYSLGLAMVVDQLDTPLFLGAIHRSVPRTSLTEFTAWAATAGATVTPLPDQDAALQCLDAHTLVAGLGTSWVSVRLPHTATSAVEWLDTLLDEAEVSNVQFHHSVDGALGQVEDLVVLLPSPTLRRIAEIASAGGVLPEKATSFQPKPPVGVLMRRITE